MLFEEPSPSLGVGDASRGMRGELEWPVRCAALCALLPASSAAAIRSRVLRVGQATVLVRPVTSMVVMVRRTAREGALLWPFVAVGRVVMISRQT